MLFSDVVGFGPAGFKFLEFPYERDGHLWVPPRIPNHELTII